MFVAGTSIEKISINDDVCVGILCMDEKEFVKQYLYPNYPSDTMRNVLLGRDIFKGQGFSEMCNGTQYQYIQNDDMDIVYRRKPGEIYFKDRLNGLLIQIKDVKEIRLKIKKLLLYNIYSNVLCSFLIQDLFLHVMEYIS